MDRKIPDLDAENTQNVDQQQPVEQDEENELSLLEAADVPQQQFQGDVGEVVQPLEDEFFHTDQQFERIVGRIQQGLRNNRPEGYEAFRAFLVLMNELENALEQPNRGLSPGRIRRFEHFTADESLVGVQCIVCLEDLQIGMNMVRLDCHVNHYLCKKCTDAWFKDHNKCPLCNHVFS